jgi:hypothetical protein
MTDIKKKQAGKTGAKAKKLQVNKETLKDLTAKDPRQLKGGRIPPCYDEACNTTNKY